MPLMNKYTSSSITKSCNLTSAKSCVWARYLALGTQGGKVPEETCHRTLFWAGIFIVTWIRVKRLNYSANTTKLKGIAKTPELKLGLHNIPV